ncbi:ATP-grasp domain-containing protein [Pleurocapsales cyanobacterium LEGE 10410]|nr:ATP-grasp domain-containing protein [Pleurocapsales cyanobacterium LEGE 10410]
MSGKIFNHDIMHCTHDAVVGNYLYSGRVLGMTEPDDLIQLHPDLQSQWTAITSHYQRIGLSHSQNPIWDTSFEQLRQHPDYEPSVFIFGDAVHDSSPDDDWFRDRNQDWQDVVEFINSKNNFIRLAEELDVKVPLTLCAEDQRQLKKHTDLPYPCYLKPAISVDGVGIYRCADPEELNNSLAKLDRNISLQVQQEVTAIKFLNLQYEVEAKTVKPLAATEQILDGFAHQGNRHPTAYQPWELVDPMAQWMTNKGMKGIFAFDVAVVETATGVDYLAIECNPRFNGASYPTGIAQKLNISHWCSDNFTTKYRSLDKIDLGELEYDRHTGTGAIIVNWGSVLVGKLGILLAGSIEQQDELRALLKQKLG